MCHALIQDLKFFQMLLLIDQELAAQARAGGCLFCDGVLHCADYPRKPRGCLPEACDAFSTRFSFCCNLCRKRCTAMSVRFLGRRVYLGLAVVLVSARHAGQIPAAARRSDALAVPIRTLDRWRKWWREQFPLTPLWQAQCARFMPPVMLDRLPGEFLDRFSGKTEEPLLRLLVFLAPVTNRPLIANQEGR